MFGLRMGRSNCFPGSRIIIFGENIIELNRDGFVGKSPGGRMRVVGNYV